MGTCGLHQTSLSFLSNWFGLISVNLKNILGIIWYNTPKSHFLLIMFAPSFSIKSCWANPQIFNNKREKKRSKGNEDARLPSKSSRLMIELFIYKSWIYDLLKEEAKNNPSPSVALKFKNHSLEKEGDHFLLIKAHSFIKAIQQFKESELCLTHRIWKSKCTCIPG